MRIATAVVLAFLWGCSPTGGEQSHEKLKEKPPAANGAAPELPSVKLVRLFPDLDFELPLGFAWPDDKSGRVCIVEQDGRVQIFKRDAPATSKVFLDISGKVLRSHNEEGLLSLAFHPKYATNGHLFVWYSAPKPRRHVLSRFTVSKTDPDKVDPASEKVFLEFNKPHGNHNGSTLLFGPDGHLYFSVGDGGSANDPYENGQKMSTLFAKIHRIDVDKPSGSSPYSIPADNPFVKTQGARGEIWALGLRNVWRMSFDRETGELWAGDVGQNKWEEIDLIVKGGNYGWSLREGQHDFKAVSAGPGALIEPVVEYGTKDGHSVTGGYVYRGSKLAKLKGAYVYADYSSGKVWALRHEKGKVVAWKEIANTRESIASFGEDWDGEIYVISLNGKVFRIEEL